MEAESFSFSSPSSAQEQVLHPTVPLETEADSYVFTKLVTFVLIMAWLVMTTATYYLRAFVDICSNPPKKGGEGRKRHIYPPWEKGMVIEHAPPPFFFRFLTHFISPRNLCLPPPPLPPFFPPNTCMFVHHVSFVHFFLFFFLSFFFTVRHCLC